MNKRIGFVGVGTMGGPMASNLVRAGYELAVFDVNPQAVDALAQLGAEPAGSAAAAARSADVIITMLPSSPNVESAGLGPSGVLEGLRRGCYWIEMSTIDPGVTRRVAAAAEERGVTLLDAPVSGSLPRAQDGTLTIMVGGSKSAFDECLPILHVLGANVIHVGDVGMGETVKLCNNLIAAINQIAVSEAFAIGVAAGVAPATLHQVVSKSSGDCWVLRTRPPYPGLVENAPVDQDWAPGFMTDLMLKDVGLALSLARQVGATSLLGAIAQQLYGAASARGHGRQDFSSVYQVIQGLVPEGEQ